VEGDFYLLSPSPPLFLRPPTNRLRRRLVPVHVIVVTATNQAAFGEVSRSIQRQTDTDRVSRPARRVANNFKSVVFLTTKAVRRRRRCKRALDGGGTRRPVVTGSPGAVSRLEIVAPRQIWKRERIGFGRAA